MKTRRAAFLTFRKLGVREMRAPAGYVPSDDNRTRGIYAVTEVANHIEPSYRDRLSHGQIIALFGWHLRWEHASEELSRARPTPEVPPQSLQQPQTPAHHMAARRRASDPGLILDILSARPPSTRPPSGPRPTSRDLHLSFVLRDGLQSFKRTVPDVPLPSRITRRLTESFQRDAEGDQGGADSFGRPASVNDLLGVSEDVRRLHAHADAHPLWSDLARWLRDRRSYATSVEVLVRAWQAEVAEAVASAGLPPLILPVEFLETLMMLVTSRPLAELAVEQYRIDAELSRVVDFTGGRGGYVKVLGDTDKPQRAGLLGLLPMSLCRMPLGGDHYVWSREAGVVQDRIRRRAEGSPAILDMCTQYASLHDERKALLDQAGRMTSADLADGVCDRCSERPTAEARA